MPPSLPSPRSRLSLRLFRHLKGYPLQLRLQEWSFFKQHFMSYVTLREQFVSHSLHCQRRLLSLCTLPFLARSIVQLCSSYYLGYLVVLRCFLLQSCPSLHPMFSLLILLSFIFYLFPEGFISDSQSSYHSLDQDERQNDIDKFCKKIRPPCADCNTMLYLRSNHCLVCGRCCTKLQGHSLLMNRCVGSGNHLVLVGLLCFNTTLLWLLMGTLLQGPLDSLLLATRLLFCFLSALLFLQDTLLNLLLLATNLTEYEMLRIERTNYLWGSIRREFHNPFDRGVVTNILEGLVPLVPCSVPGLRNWSSLRLIHLAQVEGHPMAPHFQQGLDKYLRKQQKKREEGLVDQPDPWAYLQQVQEQQEQERQGAIGQPETMVSLNQQTMV